MTKCRLLASSAIVFTSLFVFSAQAQDNGYPASAYGNAATNMETRLSAVEDQIRLLTGKVEQMDFIARRIEQALQRMQEDNEARLTKLESIPQQPVVIQSQNPAPAQQQVAQDPSAVGGGDHAANEQPQEPVTGIIGGIKVRGDKITGGTMNGKAPALPEKPADYGLTSQEHYDLAFGQLRQANYAEAEKTFKSFIDKYSKDKLIDNAKYWYGETFYVRAKFGDAAVAFADAYQQNPSGTKAPDALLKMAMSLAAMDKIPEACDTLTALKAKYPKAAANIRSRADQERARMKCK